MLFGRISIVDSMAVYRFYHLYNRQLEAFSNEIMIGDLRGNFISVIDENKPFTYYRRIAVLSLLYTVTNKMSIVDSISLIEFTLSVLPNQNTIFTFRNLITQIFLEFIHLIL